MSDRKSDRPERAPRVLRQLRLINETLDAMRSESRASFGLMRSETRAAFAEIDEEQEEQNGRLAKQDTEIAKLIRCYAHHEKRLRRLEKLRVTGR